MNYSTYTANNATHPLSAAAGISIAIVAVAFYIFYCYCLAEIAKKTGTPNSWYAYVPILNIVLMLQIIKRSLWLTLLVFLPFINLIFIIWLWAKIAQVRNRPWWWGILMIINPINLIMIWFMAFREPGGTPSSTAQVEA